MTIASLGHADCDVLTAHKICLYFTKGCELLPSCAVSYFELALSIEVSLDKSVSAARSVERWGFEATGC